MPSVNVTVSLSEVLDVRGGPLSDIEIWAILCQGAETLQDLFISEQATSEYGPAFVINPDTLNLIVTGNVEFVRAQRVQQYVNYMAPEMEDGFVMTPTAVEKIYVYALGKSLVYSAEYGLKTDQPLNISRSLESLLRSMTERNSSERMALVKVLEACSLQYERQYKGKISYSNTILSLYRSIMGIEGEEENVNDITCSNDRSRQNAMAPEKKERSRRKHRRSRNSDRSKKKRELKYRSRSRSRSSSYSRSRSHSKRRGKGRGADSPDSGYHRNTPLLTSPLPYENVQAGNQRPGRSDHLSDITFSAAQNRQQPQTKSNHLKPPRHHHKPSHKAPVANGHGEHHVGMSHRDPRGDPGNPAFRKYVKLKERQRKLRALRLGRTDDDASDELSDIVMDHMTETRSVLSLASYSQGAYHPDMHQKYGSNMALKIGRDSDRDSIISSEASVFNDQHAMRATADVSDPYIQLLQQLTSAPPAPAPVPALTVQAPPPPPQQKHTPQATAPLHKAKPFYGPEFVHNSTKPIRRIHVPLQGESRKNPGRVCRVVIVLLNGQKLEAMCDPSTTEQQLFEALITDIELPEFYFFGLTYITDGEHFFLDPDTKLHKVAPDGWKDSWKSQHAAVTFTLHLRVKFYMDNMAAFKHQTTRHSLYLQLRRDILEERCLCEEDQAVALAGLALQTEYGNYNKETMGRNYFIPEHYFSGKVVKRLGTGYIRDNAPEVHKEASGMTETDAELEFIKFVQQQVPEYGIHFHKLLKKKNETSNVAWVGININHLVLAENSGSKRIIVHQYPWADIQKISFNRRRFSVQPRPEMGQLKPFKMNFYTNTYRKGQYLLKFCTAQHSFQLKMKTRLSAPDGTAEVLEEAVSIGGTEDMEECEEESGGTDSYSGQEVEMLTREGRAAGFEAKDYVPQKQPMMYRNPPPYRPDSSASMIDLPSPDLHTVQGQGRSSGSVTKAATTGNLESVGKDPVQEDMNQTFVPSQAYVIDTSTQSLDQTVLSPHVNETISNTLNQRFKDELLSPEPVCEREVFELVLRKEPQYGIGITIVGGDSASKLDLGIFIKSVTANGPAAREGRIKPGDKLLAINGNSLEGIEHHTAVQMIKKSPADVKLLVSQVRAPGSIRKRDYDDAVFQSKLNASFSSVTDVEKSASPKLDDPSSVPVISVEKVASVNSRVDEDRGVSGGESVHTCSSIPGKSSVLEDHEILQSTTSDIHSTSSQVDSVYSKMAASALTGDEPEHSGSSSDSDSDFDYAIEAVTDSQKLTTVSSTSGTVKQQEPSDMSDRCRTYSDRSEPEVFEVCLEKKDGSFGLNVTGGVNTSVRYGGIYVKSVVSGTAADIEGHIVKGDRILEVNGVSLEGCTHKEAVQCLYDAPSVCRLLIERGTMSLSRKSSDSSYKTPAITVESVIVPEHGNLVQAVDHITQSLLETQEPTQETSLLSVSESHVGSVDVFELSHDTSVTDRQTVMSEKSLESAPSESVHVHEMSLESVDTIQNLDLTAINKLYSAIVTADNTYTIELEKGSRGLGFSVTGGHGPEVTHLSECVVRVKQVFPVGLAADSGQIRSGDVILQVNSDRIPGRTHMETMEILRKVSGHVKLLMCRPDETILPPVVHMGSEESLVLSPAAEHLSKDSRGSRDTDSSSEEEGPFQPREVLITPPTGFAPEHYPTDQEGYIIPKVVSPPPPLPVSPPPVLMRTQSISPKGEDLESDLSLEGEGLEVEVGVAELIDSCRSEEIVLIQANSWKKQDTDSNSESVTDQNFNSREVTPLSGDATPVVELDQSEEEEVVRQQLDSLSSISDGSHSSPASVIDRSQTLDSVPSVNEDNSSKSETESESESSYDVVKYDTGKSTSFKDDTGKLVPDFQWDGGLQSLPESDRQGTSQTEFSDRGKSDTGSDDHVDNDDEVEEEEDYSDDDDDGEILADNLRRLEEKYNQQEEAEDVSDRSESEEGEESASDGDLSRQQTQEEEEPLKTGEYEVTLSKPEGKGLGFTVAGGANTTRGCYIKAVLQNPALSDGTLKSGDTLIKVNGIDMRSLSHFEAVTVLREASELVTIRVYRKPDAGQVENPQTVSLSTDFNVMHGTSEGAQKAVAQGVSVSQRKLSEKSEDEDGSESDSQQSSSSEDRVPDQYTDQTQSDISTGDWVPNPDLTVSLESLDKQMDVGQSQNLQKDSVSTEGDGVELASTFTVLKSGNALPSPRSPEMSVHHIELEKPAIGGVGIGLVTAESENQTGVFVHTISTDGIADIDGRLRVGDKLLQINGESLIGLNHNKAASLLRNSEGSVRLTVSRSKSRTFSWLETRDNGRSWSAGRSNDSREGEEEGVSGEGSECEDDGLGDILEDEEDNVDDLVADARKILEEAEELEEEEEDELLSRLTQNADHKSHQYLSAAEVIDLMPDQIHVQEHEVSTVSDPAQEAQGESFSSGESWEVPVREEQATDAPQSLSDSELEKSSRLERKVLCWSDSVRKLDEHVPEEVSNDWLNQLPLVTVADSIQDSVSNLLARLHHNLETNAPLEEFKLLRNVKVTDNCSTANMTDNKPKNRFRNVLPYDETRVVLSGERDSDYINASHISTDIGGSTCSYIACQGPLPNTTDDFWDMVWQNDISVIIMLTLDMEAKKVKCHRYWPDSIEIPIEVCNGKLRLSLLYMNTLDDFDVRNILVENMTTGESRIVYHVNYTSWPDHGVPDSAIPLLQCMRLCHLLRGSAPLVVHCSAGIGRTGTFITIDLALIHIEKGLRFNIPGIVKELRRQRHGMIQTRDQYTFCYTACIEVLQNLST